MGKRWPQHPTLVSAYSPRALYTPGGHGLPLARPSTDGPQGAQSPPLSLGSPRSCLTCLAGTEGCLAHPSEARGRLSQRAERSHHKAEGL